MQRRRALVIDGDPSVRAEIRQELERHDVVAHGASGSAEALETLDGLKTDRLHLVVIELGLRDSAEEFLSRLSGLRPAPVRIGLSGGEARGAETSIEFVRGGGFDVLPRPLDGARLAVCIERAVRQLDVLAEVDELRRRLRSREGYDRLVGHSAAMGRVRDQLSSLAANDLAVWISGESGTGKELAARTLHDASSRSDRRFVVLGCAELAKGVSKGHWLLADGPVPGSPLDQASGGTLYLNEVAQLPPELQARLLTLLEDLSAAGAPRLLAGSSREPRREIDQGRLLDRLHRRLSAATLTMPPLREIRGDIPALSRHFISMIVEINHLPPVQLSPEALSLLEGYAWPGNTQELRNAIEHAVILVSDGVVRPRDLPDWVHSSAVHAAGNGAVPGALRRFRDAKREVVDAFERSYLSELLRQHGGNVTSASQEAGMLRSALQRLLRKHGLKSASFRQDRSVAAPRETGAGSSLAE
jgi:DNA-binding NtrC family response regulator